MTALQLARARWKTGGHHHAETPLDSAAPELRPLERTYSQSMSGRRSSHLTTPPDSRSMATAKSPPNFESTEMALYKYPTDVEQRAAKSRFSAADSDRRYASSFSISGTLPKGKANAIPAAHLPLSKRAYDRGMSGNTAHENKLKERLYEVRRQRLRKVLSEYATKTEFAEASGEPLSYISRLVQEGLAGRKNLGEPKARKIETRLGLPLGWLDGHIDGKPSSASNEAAGWPFRFPPKIWDDLTSAEKRRAEEQILTTIQGIQAQRYQSKETG